MLSIGLSMGIGAVSAKLAIMHRRSASVQRLLQAGHSLTAEFEHPPYQHAHEDPGNITRLPIALDPAAKSSFPKWCTELLGLENLHGVYSVSCGGSEIERKLTDSELERLLYDIQSFPELTVLDVSHSHVSDRSIATIQTLRNLKFLIVEDSQLTEPGFHRIKKSLPKLELLIGPGHWPFLATGYENWTSSRPSTLQPAAGQDQLSPPARVPTMDFAPSID